MRMLRIDCTECCSHRSGMGQDRGGGVGVEDATQDRAAALRFLLLSSPPSIQQ